MDLETYNNSQSVPNHSFTDCDLLFEPSISGPSTALMFKVVATPLILLFGIVGNILSVVVMSSRLLRRKSYSQYLSALALFDSLTLIGRQIRVVEELRAASGLPSLFQGFTDGSCKIYTFVQNVSVSMSSWIMVLMAFERFFVIFFPFRRQILYTGGRSLVAIFIIFVFICLSQIYTIIMMGYDDRRGICSAQSEYNLLYIDLYTYFHVLCIILILPMVSIVFCNVSVVLKITQYKKTRENSGLTDKSLSHISGQRFKTTVMLLTISSVYVVTLLPSVVSMFVIQTTLINAMSSNAPKEPMCSRLLAFEPYGHVLEVVSAVNYGVNFYIYVLSGQAFRSALQKMFLKEPSTTMSRLPRQQNSAL